MEHLRSLCSDPVVQALYDFSISWGDLPDDDSPLELNGWKEYLEKKKAIALSKRKMDREAAAKNALSEKPSLVEGPKQNPWKKVLSTSLLDTHEFPSLLDCRSPSSSSSSSLSSVSSPPHTPLPSPMFGALLPPPSPQKNIKGKRVLFVHDLDSSLTEMDLRTHFALFVHDLDSSLTEMDLRTHFALFGPLSSFSFPQVNGRLRGFGRVGFESPEDAEKALHGTLFIRQCPVKVEFVKHDCERQGL